MGHILYGKARELLSLQIQSKGIFSSQAFHYTLQEAALCASLFNSLFNQLIRRPASCTTMTVQLMIKGI